MSLFTTETNKIYEKLKWESWGDISHMIAFAEMKLREWFDKGNDETKAGF